MRLVDATTEAELNTVSSQREAGRGVPWVNWMERGNGEGSWHVELFSCSYEDGHGDGSHGNHHGAGNCVQSEYHLFGGYYMQLTLLEAWEYL